MDAHLIAMAIPLFFVAMGIELAVARARGAKIYRLADAISDLSCGVLNQVASIFLRGVTLGAYAWIFAHAAVTRLDGIVAWAVGFVGVDLGYYAWHRSTHRVAVLWTTHVPHHQSEDYNLAVALRQAVLEGVTNAPYYWPLALLGVPPEVFFACVSLNTLYQFWIHTRLVGRLGPLEWIFNTPSHHRVHHGIDPWAIDRNFGGVFIVWDRVFGTFEPERAEPVYGVVEGFPSWDPVRANVEPWVKLARTVAAARGLDRLRLLVKPPEWRPEGDIRIPEPTRAYRWDPPTPARAVPVVVAWFAVVALATMVVIERPLDATTVVLSAAIAASTAIWARLLTPRGAAS